MRSRVIKLFTSVCLLFCDTYCTMLLPFVPISNSRMENLVVSKTILSFMLLFYILTTPTAASTDDSKPISTTFEPLPVFSTEPMSRDQCALQFSENCHPLDTTQIRCEDNALELSCSRDADSVELRQMAVSLSKPPLRALYLTLHDGEQLNPAYFTAIRKQIIGLGISNCTSARTTAKLPQSNFDNLLELGITNCYNLDIYVADFFQSSKIRIIQFYNTTLRTLERDTFTDLPALRLISLEAELYQMNIFSDNMREYLKRLHCGCEYEWYRRWWSSNAQLLRKANTSEIYKLAYSWNNIDLPREAVYLPIDCAAEPFPNGSSAIDFTQRRFSINEEAFEDSGSHKQSCQEKRAEESFPDFSPEPITQEECSLQFTQHCGKSLTNPEFEADNCSTSPYPLEIQCDQNVPAAEVSTMTTALARFPVRPLSLVLDNIFSITHEHLTPVIKQILTFTFHNSLSNSRSVGQIKQLRLVNLLHYNVWSCYDQEIRKDDFQYSTKLRILTFFNTTIKTLEVGTFTDLPELRVLSLELHIYSGEFDDPDRLREFYIRLHCGCEYAWFRKWWSGNQRLLRIAEWKEVISGPYVNAPYPRKDIHLALDCATNTTALISDSMEFSFNDSC